MSYYRAGIGNAASYQSSGVPYASGSISAPAGSPKKISFPNVTRWVIIQNHDVTNDLYCAFSEAGLPPGDNHFMIADAASQVYMSGPRLEIKVTEMWFEGSTDFDVIAGITGIRTSEIENNWSGSVGVG